MLLDPKEFKHISHPMVESVYLKQELDPEGEGHNVLVVKFKDCAGIGTQKEREEGFLEFLATLDLLKDEMERKTGKFKRVDIQRH